MYLFSLICAQAFRLSSFRFSLELGEFTFYYDIDVKRVIGQNGDIKSPISAFPVGLQRISRKKSGKKSVVKRLCNYLEKLTE